MAKKIRISEVLGEDYQLKADNAVNAEKLGVDDVGIDAGSGTNPVYFDDGVPVASSSTVGSSTTPCYLSSGTITAGSAYVPTTGGTFSGDIIVSGHSTAIGSTLSTSDTATVTTSATNVASLSLPAGSWVITGSCWFPGASSSQWIIISLSSSSKTHGSFRDFAQPESGTGSYGCVTSSSQALKRCLLSNVLLRHSDRA